MKARDLLAALLIAAASLTIGSAFSRCQNQRGRDSPAGEVQRDTIAVHDTITIAEPSVAHRTPLRTDTVFLPTVDLTATAFDGDREGSLARCSIPEGFAVVEMPIEQKEYRDTSYQAWVSGHNVNLDSIRIFKQTDIVRIRDKLQPRRWHIGPTIGCGMTSRGFQPYIGVSLTYSLYSF